MKTYYVLLPIGEVPIGAKVTKKTGEKVYSVADKITLYGLGGEIKPISPLGVRFMIPSEDCTGNISAAPLDLVVCWHASLEDLRTLVSNADRDWK